MNQDTEKENVSEPLAAASSGDDSSVFSETPDPLLAPIHGLNPAGESLRYTDVYDQIQNARRQDDPGLPQGAWERELKRADWPQAAQLCRNALEKRSKDLQISVWLLEAWLHDDGFSGVARGLALLLALCERFWENMYPEITDGDLEPRLAPLIWMNEKLSLALKTIPVAEPRSAEHRPYNFADWESANHLEKTVAMDRSALERAEAAGRVTRAKFLGSVLFTPRAFYQQRFNELGESIEACEALNQFLEARCAASAPSLKTFLDILEGIRLKVGNFLDEKQEEDPQPLPGETAREDELEKRRPDSDKPRAFLSIRNRTEAYQMLSDAADYLLIHEPHSPVPYLVKRAVSWGQMSLTGLLAELVSDEHDLNQILKLLGIGQADLT